MTQFHDPDLGETFERPSLETTLEALREGESKGFSTAMYYGLSGLEGDALDQFSQVWLALSPGYRKKVIRAIVEVGETNLDLLYEPIGRLSLTDDDEDVRLAAIELLWEDATLETMDRLISLAVHDSSVDVRASANSALGNFILRGELGELPEEETLRAQQAVIRVWNDLDEEIDVRRRALEAISNSSHPMVEAAIRDAYESDDPRLQISAIFAMGRSCDPQWSDHVLEALDGRDEAMMYEAARAAGELEIEDAIPHLKRLAYGDDIEVKDAAIWALGEIGGHDARKALELLSRDAKRLGDDVLAEAIEDALANAGLGGNDLYMFRLDKN